MHKSSRRLRRRAKELASQQGISYQAALQKLQQSLEVNTVSRTTLSQVVNCLKDHLVNNRTVPLMLWSKYPVVVHRSIANHCKEQNLQIKKLTASSSEQNSLSLSLQDLFHQSAAEGVLLVENINELSESDTAALIKIVGQGTMTHLQWKLPSGWIVIATAQIGQGQLDSAMIDRFLHWAPNWDAQAWSKWAKQSNLNADVVDFTLQSHKQNVDSNPQLPGEIQTQIRATPRSLLYFDALSQDNTDMEVQNILVRGLLGKSGQSLIQDIQ